MPHRGGILATFADVLAILWEIEVLSDAQFLAALDRIDAVPLSNRPGEKAEEIETKVRGQ